MSISQPYELDQRQHLPGDVEPVRAAESPEQATGYAIEFDPTVLVGGSPFVRPANLVRQGPASRAVEGPRKRYIFTQSLEEAQAIITDLKRKPVVNED